MLTNTSVISSTAEFAADVRTGLCRQGQKQFPSKYLYDSLGSRLFEAICELPEYSLTRADERLLQLHAREIASRLPGNLLVCELGSGSGRKTRYVLEALARRRRLRYFPIEISPAALAVCQRELSDIDSLTVVGIEREYLDGLLEVAAQREDDQRILVLFLGSTLGNFSHPHDTEFLRELRLILRAGDALLLGTDLIKPTVQLVEAYDDPLGVTAAFNLNLLVRINRELGADFNLRQFRHRAKFNAATSSVEMHLESQCDQTVSIPGALLTVDFQSGETIWTENSHKYSLDEVSQKARTAGFRIETQWIDREFPFAESLLVADVE